MADLIFVTKWARLELNRAAKGGNGCDVN
jgi:hypothetical protein